MKKANWWKLIFVLPVFLSFGSSAWAQQNSKIELAEQYYQQGDLDKARPLYEELASREENWPAIHNAYLEILVSQQDYKMAERYLTKVIRKQDNKVRYQLDLASVYQQAGETGKAEKLYDEVIEEGVSAPFKTHMVAQMLSGRRMYEKALNVYLKARERHTDSGQNYALQLASLYSILGEQEKMFTEYFNYVNENANRLRHVKNMLQNQLREPADIEALETRLYERLQQEPNNENYPELLVWLHLQQKNFYAAFVQARALQKRRQSGPEQILEIGNIALENKAYDDAVEIFEYLSITFKDRPDYYRLRNYLIKAREEQLKITYPIDTSAIQSLLADYKELSEQTRDLPTALESLNSQAMLYAFYLNEKPRAIELLNHLISNPRIPATLKAQSKLSLGDIYLLIDEPWEAALLYAQVDKDFKDDPMGYEAKLRNAKLSYFKGEFELAQGHLDVLKEATTREIANDAMALSLLIKSNSYLDSASGPLNDYATIELMLYQNQHGQAKTAMDDFLKKWPQHSLTDEVYMQQARYYLTTGNTEAAIEKLARISQEWSHDLLADDAAFMQANLLQEAGQRDEAMQAYTEFLKKHADSVFAAEARKRFRQLRGDTIAQ